MADQTGRGMTAVDRKRLAVRHLQRLAAHSRKHGCELTALCYEEYARNVSQRRDVIIARDLDDVDCNDARTVP